MVSESSPVSWFVPLHPRDNMNIAITEKPPVKEVIDRKRKKAIVAGTESGFEDTTREERMEWIESVEIAMKNLYETEKSLYDGKIQKRMDAISTYSCSTEEDTNQVLGFEGKDGQQEKVVKHYRY